MIKGLRIVIAPRGEFSDGALGLSYYRKRLYIVLFKVFRLHKLVLFQASSMSEESDIKKVFGSDALLDIFICPNIASNYFPDFSQFTLGYSLRVIFLGRISPMKNLSYALNVVSMVKQPIVFDVYGPIEDKEYWRSCSKIIEQIPPHITVEYKGYLKPSEVSDVLCHYDLFFLPTLGENYGHVIVEALSCGVPVLISDRTPWQNLEQIGIGWDISLSDVEAFVEIIEGLAKEPSIDVANRRRMVLEWAIARFSDDAAAKKTAEMFEFALKN